MADIQRITPCLWFDDQAEAAAEFYTSIFDDARITAVTRYDKAAAHAAGRPEGSVLTVAFELDGQSFTALNGEPQFRFTPALSLIVNCDTQEEVDRYWNALSEDGDPSWQQCGWLQDRFGLSWQIVPRRLVQLLGDPDPGRSQRAMAAMLKMKKLDIARLERAAMAA